MARECNHIESVCGNVVCGTSESYEPEECKDNLYVKVNTQSESNAGKSRANE